MPTTRFVIFEVGLSDVRGKPLPEEMDQHDYIGLLDDFGALDTFAAKHQYPAYLSERFPTEVRAMAVAFCFHQGAIWGGLISPLLVWYASIHQIALSGPILVTTVVGLVIFLVAVLLSPETKGKVLVADLTVA